MYVLIWMLYDDLFKITNISFLKPFIQITAKSIVETNYEYVCKFKQIL